MPILLLIFVSVLILFYFVITTIFKKKIVGYEQKIALLDAKYLELLESNERYEIVSKATSDTIWDWDIKTDGFIWNKGIENVFGYKYENVEGNLQWLFNQIHPEDSLKMSVKLYSFISEKSDKWQDEYRFRCADGSYKYVFNRGFLVKDENNNVVRMIGVIQDFTKQKTEEQRLKLLETVITQTKDSIIITETNENDTEIPKILYVNPAFTKMTGYEYNEVLGKSSSVFINKKSVQDNIKKIAEALRKKEEYTFETLNYRKNNEPYWSNISIIPITNKDNKHSHWISIQRDISSEKEREKEREQLISELTQNNKDLKQFSYITSHNLRAPLSNLIGLLNLIEDIPIESEELSEIIDGFSKSTQMLNETINDLVKVIIIKDNPSVTKENVNLNEVISTILNQLNFLIAVKKPSIVLNLEAETIFTNKPYLESILQNLTTNSLKYNDENRPLEITITSKISNNSTQIIFKDNGIGIDLERNKNKLFGLYQRFHDYPDSKGLGLYLVKSQVDSMGGFITAESQVGVGTSFEITFKNN